MKISEAQANMRAAYFNGAPGLLVSGLVWVAAGVVAATGETRRAIIVLFIGGILIHPLAVALAKLLGRPGAHSKDNPLGRLALESTGILLLGVLLALGLAHFRPSAFFPAMLLVIGGRYLTFQTLFGLPVYWLCGGMLAVLGVLAARQNLPAATTALAGGLTELVFAAIVFLRARTGDRAVNKP